MKLSAIGLATVLAASPAIAVETASKEQIQQHVNLLGLIEALGVEIVFDGYGCNRGWHGAYKTDGTELVLCNRGDMTDEQRMDTIRHEAWHVLQDIGDCSLTDVSYPLPVLNPAYVHPEMREFAAKHYDVSLQPTEAEAFWMAEILDANQINALLYQKAKACGYKL